MRTITQVAAIINAVARINSHVSTLPEAIRPGISIGVQNGMSDMMRATTSAPAEKAITPTVLSLVPRLLEVVYRHSPLHRARRELGRDPFVVMEHIEAPSILERVNFLISTPPISLTNP